MANGADELLPAVSIRTIFERVNGLRARSKPPISCAAALAALLFGPGTGIAADAGAGPEVATEEDSIVDLARKLGEGKETSHSLTEKLIARIEAIDRKGPALASVLELNPDALQIADQLDAERKSKGPRGPLHGVPILIKDNIATSDRMMTTAGSLALEGLIAPVDAHVARRLREAGAVLLGKTNLSEWANIRSAFSTSGWSGRGGQTKNPYVLDRNASGSSSGSGAAVAAGLAPAAIGTETDGSITSPAGACALVGLKPTIGLVSRSGIIPIAHSQDTAGPMTRTVADTAIVLDAIAGVDPRDPSTLKAPKRDRAYASFLDPKGLSGARIGVVRQLFGKSPHADRVAEAAIARMKELGAVIVDPVDIPTATKLGDDELLVLLYELKADLAAYLGPLGAAARVHSLAEVIAFNEANADRELRLFGQDLFIAAEKKGPLTSKEYRTALARNQRRARAEGIDAAVKKHRLDALFGPTQGPPGLIDPIAADYGCAGNSTSLPAVAGYPHITVPGGFVAGLPIGVSFFGRAFSEGALIRTAYAFEQATHHQRPPRFLRTADLSKPIVAGGSGP